MFKDAHQNLIYDSNNLSKIEMFYIYVYVYMYVYVYIYVIFIMKEKESL